MNCSLGGPVRPKPSLRPLRVGHTALVHRRVPLPGVVGASLWCAGAGPPFGRDPRGSRRRGALRRVACGSICVPPPASRSLLGEGGRPLGAGGAEGRRSCGPQDGGEGGGGELRRSRPPAPSGVGVSSFVSGAPPWGMLVLWGLPGGRGRRARPGQLPVGQCGGGGGGGGM